MDELGFNKLFAGVLLAGLLLMAGVKFADILVPHTELAQNAYVIEVPETTDVAGAAPVETGRIIAGEAKLMRILSNSPC